MQHSRYLPLFLLSLPLFLLSLPLSGVGKKPELATSGGGGCSCGGCHGGGGEGGDEIGGGIAKSTTYTIPRAEIGSSLLTGNSGSESYRATSTLGYLLSHGVTLSDDYRTYHPLSEGVLTISPSLEAEMLSLTGKSVEAMAPPKSASSP